MISYQNKLHYQTQLPKETTRNFRIIKIAPSFEIEKKTTIHASAKTSRICGTIAALNWWCFNRILILARDQQLLTFRGLAGILANFSIIRGRGYYRCSVVVQNDSLSLSLLTRVVFRVRGLLDDCELSRIRHGMRVCVRLWCYPCFVGAFRMGLCGVVWFIRMLLSVF